MRWSDLLPGDVVVPIEAQPWVVLTKSEKGITYLHLMDGCVSKDTGSDFRFDAAVKIYRGRKNMNR